MWSASMFVTAAITGIDRASHRVRSALAALPPLEPPAREWARLEARLRGERILRGAPGGVHRLAPSFGGRWVGAAAAVAAFVVGGAGGFLLRGEPAADEGALPRVTTKQRQPSSSHNVRSLAGRCPSSAREASSSASASP